MCFSKIIKGILLVVCVIFIIAGPIAFEVYKGYKEKPIVEETPWKGIIVIWDYPSFNKEDGARYSWIANKIKQFEKENRGVFINFKPLDISKGLVEIETAAQTNTLPDIAPVGASRVIQELDILEPLNLYIDKNNMDIYIEGIKDNIIYKDNIYGIPRLINIDIIAFSKSIFDTQEEEIPNTGQILLVMADAIIKKTGFPFKIKDTALVSMALCFKEYPIFEKIIQGNQFKETNSLYSDFEKKNFSTIACSTMDIAQIDYVFGIHGDYNLVPLVTEKEQKLIGTCWAYGVIKQEDKKKVEMCIKFINFLTNSEEQLGLVKFNAFPVMKSTQGIYKEENDLKKIEELFMNSGKILINTLSENERSNFMYIYNKK